MLIVGRSHLEQVLRVYAYHYNAHRPHRSLGLEPPNPPADLPVVDASSQKVSRATCSADSSTNTNDKLRERICAPYGAIRPSAGVGHPGQGFGKVPDCLVHGLVMPGTGQDLGGVFGGGNDQIA
jgi:hypothetical protein